jgi:hypothetical protein
MALNILQVVGNPAALGAADIWVHDRLVTQGHTVTYIDDSSAAPGNLTSYNLVMITDTATSAQVSTKYDSTTVGVVSVNAGAYPHSKFNTTSAFNGASTTAYYVLAANGDPVVPNNNAQTVTFRTVGDTYLHMLDTGFGSGVTLLLRARVDLTARVVGARYATGALMSDGVATAPSPRVVLELMDPTALNATGLAWFDNAVTWAKTNTLPVANAGPDQTVDPNRLVTLTGAASTDDGTISGYTWRQISGTAVTLSSTSVVSPTFTSPASITGATLVFGLIVTDNQAGASAEDTVTITVRGSAKTKVRISGAWVEKPIKSRVSGAWQN